MNKRDDFDPAYLDKTNQTHTTFQQLVADQEVCYRRREFLKQLSYIKPTFSTFENYLNWLDSAVLDNLSISFTIYVDDTFLCNSRQLQSKLDNNRLIFYLNKEIINKITNTMLTVPPPGNYIKKMCKRCYEEGTGRSIDEECETTHKWCPIRILDNPEGYKRRFATWTHDAQLTLKDLYFDTKLVDTNFFKISFQIKRQEEAYITDYPKAHPDPTMNTTYAPFSWSTDISEFNIIISVPWKTA